MISIYFSWSVIKWLFAKDHYHYASWLTVHLTDLFQLDINCPDIYSEFSNQKKLRDKRILVHNFYLMTVPNYQRNFTMIFWTTNNKKDWSLLGKKTYWVTCKSQSNTSCYLLAHNTSHELSRTPTFWLTHMTLIYSSCY